MSAIHVARLPDHQALREQPARRRLDRSVPVGATPGAEPVSATRVHVRDGRVVFAQDLKLWVYRSYPVSIAPRPGRASEASVPSWHTRAIVVEPQDLSSSDELDGCSVVYAMWPSGAAWWEAAPFTVRHSDHILHYDRLFTSLVPFPDGCDVSLLGHVRPITGHIRDDITERRRENSTDRARVKVRSALLLDPMRLAPELTTGRRARGHPAAEDAEEEPREDPSIEVWHWSVVKDLEGCVATLLDDPEVRRFKESVSRKDFLLRWYASVSPERFKVPLPEVEQALSDMDHLAEGEPTRSAKKDWKEDWLLREELREAGFVDDLLEDAARYALAGPHNYEAYLDKCRSWHQAGRRPALLDENTPLVFPLLQNVYVNWLEALQKRLGREDGLPLKARMSKKRWGDSYGGGGVRRPASIRRAVEARLAKSVQGRRIQAAKLELSQLPPSRLAHDLARALLSLPGHRFRPEPAPDAESGKRAPVPNPADGEPMPPGEASVLLAAGIELLEGRLFAAAREQGLSNDVRSHLLEFKERRSIRAEEAPDTPSE